MIRLGQTVLLILVGVGVALDPYSWHRTASDAVLSAPWWQVALAIVSLALLVACIAQVWRGRSGTAAALLLAEVLIALTGAAALVQRDGVTRFVRGFGAEQYLSWFLVLVALRVLVLYSLLRRTAEGTVEHSPGAGALVSQSGGRVTPSV